MYKYRYIFYKGNFTWPWIENDVIKGLKMAYLNLPQHPVPLLQICK